jgi:GT2 family glycosyltransferase
LEPIGNICAIVLDYDGAEKTEKCLTSLIGQKLRTAYVLDNAALPGAHTRLRAAVERVRQKSPEYEIEILRGERNLGFARGVNFVLSHDRRSRSGHDYYLLLNNDALAGPGLVSGLLDELGKHPDAALVAPRIISSDAGREQGIWYHRYFGLLLSRPGKLRFHYFTGCCLLVRKESTSEWGLFDEAFFMYGEDAELGWRLTRQGRKMICATNIFVRHELGPSAERTSLFYEYHMVRSHLLLGLRTWLHPAEIPLILSAKFIALACRAVLRFVRGRNLAPLAGFLLAWIPSRTGGLRFKP